jgi:signal transduction histidine kinase/HAMP domain-containing protein
LDGSTGMSRFHIRTGIRQKILLGFVAMALMIGALGGYGIYVLEATGRMVAQTYDRPLLTVNYSRLADQIFTQMQNELLRRRYASPAEKAAIDRDIAKLGESLGEDLSMARAQALSDAERAAIDAIEERVAHWNELWQAAPSRTEGHRLQDLSTQIGQSFDQLVALTIDHSLAQRREDLSAIARFQSWTIAAMVLALVIAGAITFFLARRIVRPFSMAVSVADRIAGGQLDTVIPRGFGDETGVLLQSMSVMRDGIRAMMARERTRRRAAETRLADALESAHEGLVLIDASGTIVIANKQIGAFFPPLAPLCREGIQFSAVTRLLYQQLLHPEKAPNLFALPPSGFELHLVDGRWIHVSSSRTRDGGQFFFFTDFSDVKEREQRYREAQLQAEAASRAKSSFVANMSHELRTPLNAIIGFSEIMQREMFGKLENRNYAGYIADILQSGRHLLAIINGVLDLAKSQSGKLTVHFETVDLGQILVDCASMMRDQCARGELILELTKPPVQMLVSGEPAKLRQVLLNLLSNAVKFTEPGGRVALSARDEGDTIVVDVRDTGIGMSSDDIAIALTPFGQVDNRLARRFDGTGLGLPLAKELIELHRGTLIVDSEPARGSTISVVLPKQVPTEKAGISASAIAA